MFSAKRERELRRAVDRLSHCAMDDIEWIWSTLNSDQRDRLRPLLATVRADWKALLEEAADNTPELPFANEATDDAKFASLIRCLPTEIGKRILASMKDEQRQAVVAKLPTTHGAAVHINERTSRMTERARQSLLAAARARLSDIALEHTPRKPVQSRIKRWMGRR